MNNHTAVGCSSSDWTIPSLRSVAGARLVFRCPQYLGSEYQPYAHRLESALVELARHPNLSALPKPIIRDQKSENQKIRKSVLVPDPWSGLQTVKRRPLFTRVQNASTKILKASTHGRRCDRSRARVARRRDVTGRRSRQAGINMSKELPWIPIRSCCLDRATWTPWATTTSASA